MEGDFELVFGVLLLQQGFQLLTLAAYPQFVLRLAVQVLLMEALPLRLDDRERYHLDSKSLPIAGFVFGAKEGLGLHRICLAAEYLRPELVVGLIDCLAVPERRNPVVPDPRHQPYRLAEFLNLGP